MQLWRHVSQLDGQSQDELRYSNDSVAWRERTADGQDLHDGKGVSQDVNCVDLVWNVVQRHCERQRNGQVHR